MSSWAPIWRWDDFARCAILNSERKPRWEGVQSHGLPSLGLEGIAETWLYPIPGVVGLSGRAREDFRTCLEIHLSKFCAPLDKKSRTNIKVELGKCVSPFRLVELIGRWAITMKINVDTDQVCIPHAYRILHTDFSHKQTIHPTECKLHKLDILRPKMRVKWCCRSLNSLTRRMLTKKRLDEPSIRATSSDMRFTLRCIPGWADM